MSAGASRRQDCSSEAASLALPRWSRRLCAWWHHTQQQQAASNNNDEHQWRQARDGTPTTARTYRVGTMALALQPWQLRACAELQPAQEPPPLYVCDARHRRLARPLYGRHQQPPQAERVRHVRRRQGARLHAAQAPGWQRCRGGGCACSCCGGRRRGWSGRRRELRGRVRHEREHVAQQAAGGGLQVALVAPAVIQVGMRPHMHRLHRLQRRRHRRGQSLEVAAGRSGGSGGLRDHVRLPGEPPKLGGHRALWAAGGGVAQQQAHGMQHTTHNTHTHAGVSEQVIGANPCFMAPRDDACTQHAPLRTRSSAPWRARRRSHRGYP